MGRKKQADFAPGKSNNSLKNDAEKVEGEDFDLPALAIGLHLLRGMVRGSKSPRSVEDSCLSRRRLEQRKVHKSEPDTSGSGKRSETPRGDVFNQSPMPIILNATRDPQY
jgi:hypothetical protein